MHCFALAIPGGFLHLLLGGEEKFVNIDYGRDNERCPGNVNPGRIALPFLFLLVEEGEITGTLSSLKERLISSVVSGYFSSQSSWLRPSTLGSG